MGFMELECVCNLFVRWIYGGDLGWFLQCSIYCDFRWRTLVLCKRSFFSKNLQIWYLATFFWTRRTESPNTDLGLVSHSENYDPYSIWRILLKGSEVLYENFCWLGLIFDQGWDRKTPPSSHLLTSCKCHVSFNR